MAANNTINGRTPEEIKRGLELCCVGRCSECPYREECDEYLACGGEMLPADVVLTDILALIQQLQEDKKHLQEIICNQRRQLRLLHAMYEWALSRLQKAYLNDRAHFQAWMRERGYDLKTMELPESKYQQLERERDALFMETKGFCASCAFREKCHTRPSMIDNSPPHRLHLGDCEDWQWRGVPREVGP